MFDSPFDHCPRCGEIVLLDQTLKECAREHHCADTSDCPLRRLFCGHDFSTGNTGQFTENEDGR
jgi:hypothetical protein